MKNKIIDNFTKTAIIKIGSQSAGWFPLPKGGGCYEYIRNFITYDSFRNTCSYNLHRHKKITTPPTKLVWLFYDK